MQPLAKAFRNTMANQFLLKHTADIQGDILAGFRKDHKTLLFLHFPDGRRGRAWMRRVADHIASNDKVAQFNDTFRSARKEQGKDPISSSLRAVWTGLA